MDPEKRIDLEECILKCAGIPEFVAEFNRLTGRELGRSLRRTSIEVLIDDAVGVSGESKEDMAAFAAFVHEFVWCTLPEEAFDPLERESTDGQENSGE